MQKALETVHVDPAILSYIVEIVQRTREDHRVVNGHRLVLASRCLRPVEPLLQSLEEIMLFQMTSRELRYRLFHTEST